MNFAENLKLQSSTYYGISKVSPVFGVKYSTEQRQKKGKRKGEPSTNKGDDRYDGIRLDLHQGEREEKISPIMYDYGKVLIAGGRYSI